MPLALPRYVAAVEEGDAVRVLHLRGAETTTYRELPAQARGLRFSRDGRHVAWVLDLRRAGQPVSSGFVWRAGEPRPVSLGILGMRRREAPGLALGDGGRVAWTDEEGRLKLRDPAGVVSDLGEGAMPLFGAGDLLVHVGAPGSCVQAPPPTPQICGRLVRPLALDGRTLFGQSEQRLAIVAPGREEYIPMLQLIAARPGPGGQVLVTRIEQFRDKSFDELGLFEGGKLRPLGQYPVLTSAEWDRDGTVLLVRAQARRSVYDQLLAHAMEEFGGEASVGEAVRLELAGGAETPISELAGRRVRALFAPEEPAPATPR